MMEGTGTLENQLEATKKKSADVRNQRSQLKHIEDLSAAMEERLILDNRYTEHSTVSLAQQWDQLDQLGMRMQHNLEQQIQACNQSGVSEEALREFSMMFKVNKPTNQLCQNQKITHKNMACLQTPLVWLHSLQPVFGLLSLHPCL